MMHKIKRLLFKLRHGFDYADTWNLDDAFIKWLRPRLVYFRDNLNSYPSSLNSVDEWYAILNEMVEGLDEYDSFDFDCDKVHYQNFETKFLNNFVKYFRDLWD